MAEFKANFAELGFYVNGERKQFNNFVYNTENKKEIDVLESLRDVKRVDEPKKQQQQKPAEDKGKKKGAKGKGSSAK